MIVMSAIKGRDDKVYVGHRHHDIISGMVNVAGVTPPIGGRDIQGFCDDSGDFLTREAARAAFVACGQLGRCSGMPPHPDLLFSEDLY